MLINLCDGGVIDIQTDEDHTRTIHNQYISFITFEMTQIYATIRCCTPLNFPLNQLLFILLQNLNQFSQKTEREFAEWVLSVFEREGESILEITEKDAFNYDELL